MNDHFALAGTPESLNRLQGNVLQEIGEILKAPGGCLHSELPELLRQLLGEHRRQYDDLISALHNTFEDGTGSVYGYSEKELTTLAKARMEEHALYWETLESIMLALGDPEPHDDRQVLVQVPETVASLVKSLENLRQTGNDDGVQLTRQAEWIADALEYLHKMQKEQPRNIMLAGLIAIAPKVAASAPPAEKWKLNPKDSDPATLRHCIEQALEYVSQCALGHDLPHCVHHANQAEAFMRQALDHLDGVADA